MSISAVPQEIQRFAREHDLPKPKLYKEADGLHAFMYSRDESRRYAYSLTWADDQKHILWVKLNPGTGETEGRNHRRLGQPWSKV